MMKSLKYGLYVSTALTLTTGYPAAAWAQSADGGQPSVQEIEQVVVTATRREERLQDVPISISVFNQQQLTNNNVTTASDLATITPSLSADTRFGSDISTFAIRGFTQEIRTTPSVGVYFADVVAPSGGGSVLPAGDGAGPGNMFDLQNVQVLKGPQGTLFGRNTTGGAVLLVPAKPTSEFGGYVEGSFGNYNMKGGQGVLNIPLNDTMRLRLGVDHMSRDGYENNISGVGPSHFGDVDYTALRASFDVDITPDLENYTIASYAISDHVGTIPKIIAADPTSLLGSVLAGPQVAAQAGKGFYAVMNTFPNPRSKLEQWQVINNTTWHASDDLTIKNLMSYAELSADRPGEDLGNDFHVPFGAYAGYPFNLDEINIPPGTHTASQSTFTEELQFQGNALDNKLIWQGGFYVQLSDPIGQDGSIGPNYSFCSAPLNKAPNGDFDPICIDAFGIGGGAQLLLSKTTYRDYAAYAQASYDLTDEIKLTGGIRYTYDRSEGWGQQLVFNYFSTPAAAATYYATRAGGPIPYFAEPNSYVSCSLGFPTSSLKTTQATSCITKPTQTSQAPTWIAELQYTPADNQMYYAKYSRGYRQGNVMPTAPYDFQTYKPEKLDAYEIGAKTSWDGMLPGVFDVAAFYNDFTNEQIQFGFGPLSILTSNFGQSAGQAIFNGKKSRIFGTEATLSVSPLKDLRFDLSYSYLNTKLVKYDLATAGTLANLDGFSLIPTSIQGQRLPNTPENKLTLTGTYNLPIPETMGKLSVSATYIYVGSLFTGAPVFGACPQPAFPASPTCFGSPYSKIAPHGEVNLNLNWLSIGGSQFDASAFVTNLTDKNYYTYVAGAYEGYGFESATLGEPSMYGVRLRYNFD